MRYYIDNGGYYSHSKYVFHNGKINHQEDSYEEETGELIPAIINEITKEEYDEYIDSLPVPPVVDKKAQYAAAGNKMDYIANELGLI